MLRDVVRGRGGRARHSTGGGVGQERSRVARPTLAAVLFVASGLVVLATVLATGSTRDLPVTLSSTTTPVAVLIGCCLAACGVSVWAQPATRVFAGLMGLAASLAALPGANLGGALLGTVLGVVASAAALSWTPDVEEPDTSTETNDAAGRDDRDRREGDEGRDDQAGLDSRDALGTADPAPGRHRPARHRVSV